MTVITLLMACLACQSGSPPRKGAIGSQEAIRIAKEEIVRRKIALPRAFTIKVKKGTLMVEAGPDILLYAVSFYAPDRRKAIPLYTVSISPQTGKIYDFTDTHIIHRGDH